MSQPNPPAESQAPKATLFRHALPDGRIDQRASRHAYTHVAVIETTDWRNPGQWVWYCKYSKSAELAARTVRSLQTCPGRASFRNARVEAINDGVRS